jgi:16S rRNA processing protein RimM
MTREDYRLIGSVVKTRGISGEVVIRSKISTSGIDEVQKFVMIKIDGLLVPFFIESWQILSQEEIILKFRDTDTRDKADKLKNKEIWLPWNKIKNFHIPPTEDLTGYEVIDISTGNIGRSTGILNIPGNELLRIEYQERELLLPIQEGIIVEINSKKKFIRVDLPDGFLGI